MKILVERHGAITTVIINRPEVRNAVDPETATALREAFRAFDADQTSAVAVLCGAGGCFCAGYDLKYLAAHGLPSGLGMRWIVQSKTRNSGSSVAAGAFPSSTGAPCDFRGLSA